MTKSNIPFMLESEIRLRLTEGRPRPIAKIYPNGIPIKEYLEDENNILDLLDYFQKAHKFNTQIGLGKLSRETIQYLKNLSK